MTVQSKSQIKSYFVRGAKPTQSEFGDLVDSYQDYSPVLSQAAFLASVGATGLIDVKSNVSAELVTYGTVGLQVLQSITATSAKQVLNIGAAVSAEFATTAQAIAGAVDGISMSPVLTKNSIFAFALTSAQFATTAQALAGQSNGTVMNPSVTKAVTDTFQSGLVLLATYSTSASLVNLNVTGILSSTYDDYQVLYDSVRPAVATAELQIQFSRTNGSSYDIAATDYAYCYNFVSTGGVNSPAGSTGAAHILLTGNTGGASAESTSGSFILNDVNQSNFPKCVRGSGVNINSAGLFALYTYAGQRLSVNSGLNPVNAFRLRWTSSAAFTDGGTVRIYGFKK